MTDTAALQLSLPLPADPLPAAEPYLEELLAEYERIDVQAASGIVQSPFTKAALAGSLLTKEVRRC